MYAYWETVSCHFLPRLIGVSALPCKTVNIEIASFHFNDVCWFANKHTKFVLLKDKMSFATCVIAVDICWNNCSKISHSDILLHLIDDVHWHDARSHGRHGEPQLCSSQKAECFVPRVGLVWCIHSWSFCEWRICEYFDVFPHWNFTHIFGFKMQNPMSICLRGDIGLYTQNTGFYVRRFMSSTEQSKTTDKQYFPLLPLRH